MRAAEDKYSNFEFDVVYITAFSRIMGLIEINNDIPIKLSGYACFLNSIDNRMSLYEGKMSDLNFLYSVETGTTNKLRKEIRYFSHEVGDYVDCLQLHRTDNLTNLIEQRLEKIFTKWDL